MFSILGMAYHEKCDCPQPSLSKWLKDMECPKSYSQIKQDLSIFQNIDMAHVENEAIARFNQRGAHSLCHYVIKDNKVKL